MAIQWLVIGEALSDVLGGWSAWCLLKTSRRVSALSKAGEALDAARALVAKKIARVVRGSPS
jgi:hypothetical protein